MHINTYCDDTCRRSRRKLSPRKENICDAEARSDGLDGDMDEIGNAGPGLDQDVNEEGVEDRQGGKADRYPEATPGCQLRPGNDKDEISQEQQGQLSDGADTSRTSGCENGSPAHHFDEKLSGGAAQHGRWEDESPSQPFDRCSPPCLRGHRRHVR